MPPWYHTNVHVPEKVPSEGTNVTRGTARILVTAIVGALIASVAVVAGPAPPAEAAMCDPITLDEARPDFYGEPEEEPAGPDVDDSDPSTTTTTTAPADPTSTTTTATTAPPDSTTTTVPATTAPTTTEPPTPATTEPPTTTTTEPPCTPFVKAIHSPLPWAVSVGSRFGADRDGGSRLHAGIDMSVPRLTPILAAADGVVEDLGSDGCCAMTLRHDDGWITRYVHLNNDRSGTDDGLGVGIPPWITIGTPVLAGQVIGWVGDSTNAEDTVPHLHFELRMPDGTPIDALASYRAAEGRGDVFEGPFVDDDDHPAAPFIDRAASLGAVMACGERFLHACPNDELAAADAELLVAALTGFEVPAPRPDLSGLVDAIDPATDLAALAEADIPPPTVDQLTAMFREAAALRAASDRLAAAAVPTADGDPTPEGDEAVLDAETDDTEPAIDDTADTLAVGCLWQPPTGDRVPTRAEAVVVALVAVGEVEVPTCDFGGHLDAAG